jgi:hypothetical protein
LAGFLSPAKIQLANLVDRQFYMANITFVRLESIAQLKHDSTQVCVAGNAGTTRRRQNVAITPTCALVEEAKGGNSWNPGSLPGDGIPPVRSIRQTEEPPREGVLGQL